MRREVQQTSASKMLVKRKKRNSEEGFKTNAGGNTAACQSDPDAVQLEATAKETAEVTELTNLRLETGPETTLETKQGTKQETRPETRLETMRETKRGTRLETRPETKPETRVWSDPTDESNTSEEETSRVLDETRSDSPRTTELVDGSNPGTLKEAAHDTGPLMTTELVDRARPSRLEELLTETAGPPMTTELVDGARPGKLVLTKERLGIEQAVAKTFSYPKTKALPTDLKGEKEMEDENAKQLVRASMVNDITLEQVHLTSEDDLEQVEPLVREEPPTRPGERVVAEMFRSNNLVVSKYSGWLVYERGRSGINTQDVDHPSRAGTVSLRRTGCRWPTKEPSSRGHKSVVTADEKAKTWQERYDASWEKLGNNTAHTTAGDIVRSEQMVTEKTDLITRVIEVRKYWRRYSPTEKSGDAQAGEPGDEDPGEKDPRMSKRPTTPKRFRSA